MLPIMGQQAENVMASLMKEYVNESQKQDEQPNSCETNDNDITTDKDKDASMDNVLDNNENASHELDSRKDASGCCEDGEKEDQCQPQKSSSSENGRSSVPQFKNIVAIVDPPRGGLHPTVSNEHHPHITLAVLLVP